MTGASGFIGAAVCHQLMKAGAQVWGTGRTRVPSVSTVGLQALLPDDAARIVREAKPEVVFHLASPIALEADGDADKHLRLGIVEATRAVTMACIEGGARLVHVGTCAEYGPIDAPFCESDTCEPTGAYGILKLEATLWVLEQAHALEVGVVRPFRTYGPGDDQSLVAQVCRAALSGTRLPMTDGAQVREWNHVDAIATGINAAGAHPDAVGRLLNLGGGPQLSVRDMARQIELLAGSEGSVLELGALPRRPGEVDRFWGYHESAQALWGALPGPNLDDGLVQTLSWHRNPHPGNGS